MKITEDCPFCGKSHSIEISDVEHNKMLNAGINATALTIHEKEFLISGMCFECHEKTFNNPLPEHKEAWGELVTECNICGCNIYEKDYVEEGVYKCPSCGIRSDAEMEEPVDE